METRSLAREFTPVIGLEVHVYPATLTKMFCNCRAELSEEANTNICPTCTAQPGSKPLGLNKNALLKAIQLARALKCKFAQGEIQVLRKHYFYPDLPNNYQRTSQPIGIDGEFLGIRITELHVEQDPGQYELKR